MVYHCRIRFRFHPGSTEGSLECFLWDGPSWLDAIATWIWSHLIEKTPIMRCLCQNVSRKLKGCALVESTPPPGMWGIITTGGFWVLSCFTLCIGHMLWSVRCSSVLSSHSCAQKYLLTAHSPNPFISLYLLLQTIPLLEISATLGPLGLYPAAVLESDWADHPPAVSFPLSDGVWWGQTWQSEFQ